MSKRKREPRIPLTPLPTVRRVERPPHVIYENEGVDWRQRESLTIEADSSVVKVIAYAYNTVSVSMSREQWNEMVRLVGCA